MSDRVVVTCPSCGKASPIAAEHLGRRFACPACRQPFTGVAGAPPSVSPAVPPPLPAAFPPPLPTAPQSPPAMAYADWGTPGQGTAAKLSVAALLSLIFGCLFFVPVMGLVATVLGGVGIAQTAPGKARGRGLAVAGLTLGIVGLLLTLLFAGVMLPALSIARHAANVTRSQANLRKLSHALRAYQNDYGGELPPDLATLYGAETKAVSAADFVDRNTTDTPAPSAGLLLAGGHCSYTYVPPPPYGTRGRPRVVLYETVPGNGLGVYRHVPVSNVLMSDGKIVPLTPALLASDLRVQGSPVPNP